MRNPVCCLRILHYWQSLECRELFLSSPTFTAVFATPGLVPELDDLADERWLQTATRLARLPRREWMDRLGLPPTHQVVRLFSRLRPYLIATKLPVIHEVFADPIARRQLSDTICEIPAYLLRFFHHQPLPGTNSIRHLNRPLDLIQLSADHNLCLEKFIDPIIRGEYALYRIDLNGHFAAAGLKRTENGDWTLDQIRTEKRQARRGGEGASPCMADTEKHEPCPPVN